MLSLTPEDNQASCEFYSPAACHGLLQFEIQGEREAECLTAIEASLVRIDTHGNEETINALQGVKVKIGEGLVDGGGQAIASERLVLMDYSKMKMSLQESENFLVEKGEFLPGQRTKCLPRQKDESWSTLRYELVHELAHIIDETLPGPMRHRLPRSLSPTLYGKKADHEAFAEAFTYWIYDQPLPDLVQRVMTQY